MRLNVGIATPHYTGTWQPRHFEVMLRGGVASTVDVHSFAGKMPHVCGPFGLHCVSEEGDEWCVTHLASGFRMSDFWYSFGDAVEVCDRVFFVCDWFDMTPQRTLTGDLIALIKDELYAEKDEVPF